MRTGIAKSSLYDVVPVSVAFAGSACNTTTATLDTFAKFTSSTSPDSYFDADGLVTDSQKANLFTAVGYENLQEDIGRGKWSLPQLPRHSLEEPRRLS